MLHSFRWITPTLRRLVGPRPRRKPPTARPRLEVLEDRTVPATLRVNSLLDTATPDASLTLREAIDIVNIGNTNGRSAEEIALITGPLRQNDVIELNLAGTITLGSDVALRISQPCTINHTGGALTIRGNGSRIFVTTSTVAINGGAGGLTLDGADSGGVISNQGSLSLDRLTILNGLFQGNGGGIFNSGSLTVTNSTFDENDASDRGGAIFNTIAGTLNVTGCTFVGNGAFNGGAIFNAGKATILASTFSGNQALDGPEKGPLGAAIFHETTAASTTLLVDHCTLVNNRVRFADGAAIFATLGGNVTPGSDLAASVRRSILTGNTIAGNVFSDLAGSKEFRQGDVTENIFSQSNRPAGAATKNFTGISSTDVFGPVPALAFNGGPTRTFAPIQGLTPGKNLTPAKPPVPDQRGGPFGPIGSKRDPGAIQFMRELTVDTLEDTDDGNYLSGQFSLREAIRIANADPGTNRISFAENLSGTIRLTNGELFITGSSAPTNITGPGADKLTIDAQGNSRVLQVDFGAVAEVVGLTLTNGKASAGLPLEGGGAIVNRGFLDMTDVLVTSSIVDSANGGGGGIFNTPDAFLTLNRVGVHGNSAPQSFGGGLLNEGTATITSSSIAGNTVTAAGFGVGGGGGIDNGGTLTLRNSSVLFNTATEFGGGILNAGTMTLLNTTVAGNSAFLGAGIYTEDFATPPFASTTLTNTLVAGNIFPFAPPTPNDLGGKSVDSASKNNLIGDANSAGGLAQGTNGNLVGVADLTTVLAFDNGTLQVLKNGAAETLSVALVENVNNPAIDAGDDAAAAVLIKDQSNVRARKIGSHVDIGAFEQSFTAPTVVKSVDPDLTFEVQFDEAVTGVDASDFQLVTSPGMTASITNVTGSGDVYFVTVQVTGDGQVRLNVVDNNSIVDAVIIPLGGPALGDGNFTGTPETIDETPPTLSAANIDDGEDDNQVDIGTQLIYTLTFSEDLDATTVTEADFNNAGTATVTIDVAGETEPGVVRVLVTPTTVGTVILRIPTGADIRDVAGNSLVVPVQDADTVQALPVPTNRLVDTAGDVDDGIVTPGNLSLREAIRLANETAGPDVIRFAANVALITLTNELVVSDSTSIDGTSQPGGVTIDGGPGTNRIFDVGAGVLFELTRLTLTGGNGTGANLTDRGGAVNSQGALVINDCTFAGNSAPFGGAIHSYNQGTMAVRNSTFRNNTAGTFGGAILDNGTDAAPSSLTQCTFTDNSSGTGGAIFNFSTITMTHCTVAGNDGGGGIVGSFTSVLTLVNSIVSDNVGDDVRLIASNASLIRQGVNIIETFTLGSGTESGPAALTVDPLLGPLANNGGPTQTMALLAGSPAINAGNNASVPADLATDQRGTGFARLVPTTVDLGAFEVQPANQPPVIDAQTFTVAENSANATVVGTVVASDPDAGQTRTFAITAGNTSAAFAIDPLSGQITVANTAALNFRTTPTFNLTVQVTDNGNPVLSASGSVVVNLREVVPPVPPSAAIPPAVVARVRHLSAQMLKKKLGKKAAKRIRFVKITSDDGTLSLELRLRFQDAAGFKGISVAVRTVGGVDQVVAFAKKGKKTVEAVLL